MISNFLNFVNNRLCFHWGHCDKTILEKSKIRLNIDFSIETFDIHKFCVKNEIVFWNCLNYKLKHIGERLFNNNLINYEHSQDFEGLKLYELFKEWDQLQVIDMEIFNKILDYNLQDVYLLNEIRKYLISSYKTYKQLV